jgi:hypothetical protein
MRRAWRECPRKVYYGWVASIQPATNKRALVIGSAYHAGLEAWRKTRDMRQALASSKGYLAQHIADGIVPDYAEAQVCAYVFGYLAAFREGPFASDMIEASIFEPDDGEGGSCDAIANIGGKLWVVEDKTTSSWTDYDDMAAALRMNDQITTYLDGLRKRGLPVVGVKYRQVKKTMTKQTQKETREQYATRMLEAYSDPSNYREFEITLSDAELRRTFKERERTNLEMVAWFDRYDVNEWPYNCNACIGPYGACDFVQLCNGGRDGSGSFTKVENREALDNGNYQRKIWNGGNETKTFDYTEPFGNGYGGGSR